MKIIDTFIYCSEDFSAALRKLIEQVQLVAEASIVYVSVT